MEELVKVQPVVIGGEEVNAVNARDLHVRLEVGRDFSTWFKERTEKYKFIEGEDYTLPETGELETRGFQEKVEYFITLDMAKELSMVENNEQGRVARKYFIAVEKAFKNQKPVIPEFPLIREEFYKTLEDSLALGYPRHQALETATAAFNGFYGTDVVKYMGFPNEKTKYYTLREIWESIPYPDEEFDAAKGWMINILRYLGYVTDIAVSKTKREMVCTTKGEWHCTNIKANFYDIGWCSCLREDILRKHYERREGTAEYAFMLKML